MKKVLNYLLFILYNIMFILFIAFYIMFVIGLFKDIRYYDTWQLIYMIMTSGVCWAFMLYIIGNSIGYLLKKNKENNREEK